MSPIGPNKSVLRQTAPYDNSTTRCYISSKITDALNELQNPS